MKKIYATILFTLIYTNAYAGISVCHTGQVVTNTALRGNQIPGCEYITENDNYAATKTLIKTVPRHYLKWTTELEEMTQAEKDAVDQAEADAREAALRAGSQSGFDGQTVTGLQYRALVQVILDEINILRSAHSLTPRTLTQAKTAIKNEITSGSVDE